MSTPSWGAGGYDLFAREAQARRLLAHRAWGYHQFATTHSENLSRSAGGGRRFDDPWDGRRSGGPSSRQSQL